MMMAITEERHNLWPNLLDCGEVPLTHAVMTSVAYPYAFWRHHRFAWGIEINRMNKQPIRTSKSWWGLAYLTLLGLISRGWRERDSSYQQAQQEQSSHPLPTSAKASLRLIIWVP